MLILPFFQHLKVFLFGKLKFYLLYSFADVAWKEGLDEVSSFFRLTVAVRPWILSSGIERNFSFSPDAVRRLPWEWIECVTASSGYSL